MMRILPLPTLGWKLSPITIKYRELQVLHTGSQWAVLNGTHSNDVLNHILQERVVMYGVANIVVR